MPKTDSKTCIRELAISRIKRNPFQSVMITSSILLTLTLFITVLSIFFGILKISQTERLYYGGSDYHALISSDAPAIKNNPLVKEYSVVYDIGNMISLGGDQYFTLMTSDTNFSNHIMADLVGAWPTNKNEMVLHETIVNKLGLSGKLLEPFSIEILDKKYNFVLCGILHTKSYSSMENIGFVSEEWIDLDRAYVSPSTYIMLKNPFFIESSIKQIIQEAGIHAGYQINEAYLGNLILKDYQSLMMITLALVILMISGSLLIYNIFYISILQDG